MAEEVENLETETPEETEEVEMAEEPTNDNEVLSLINSALDKLDDLTTKISEFIEREPAVSVANGETITDEVVDEVADELEEIDDNELVKPIDELDLSI